ncbi:MAG: bifunctional tRNA (5-methylaminomethyl-2-thiouridine)(34)-methyltransferase MnmD/FAD-dependent 5-carboxymethylaminomethyl-2-thiouridine(34) oxidoreductase MnmC [Marinicaulis sp.]|nr:bifunctional tRNA (5-methylaminomethyl-2-thiouridine)(34)-methyltransferase MnmD/FAD-dependent 5-carboxymethylaminomethyl-2-thiouridine(34) oxidoreductase MnmC [Marinicaulis sp.]
MSETGPITPANIIWRDDGTPFAPDYDDIYFADNGVEETRHVFLAGNDLPQRIQTTQNLNVGEIGFGTGLNFLTLCMDWRRAEKSQSARLNFVSVEAHPLTREDFLRAHQGRAGFRNIIEEIIDQYPPMHAGVHRLILTGNVTLTLIYGDALKSLENYEASIDAWFLDGFAPAKNPKLWSEDLMREIARLSSPGATIATFTVAGAARRALIAAGFDLEKRKGFGRKREMLVGKIENPPTIKLKAAWFRGFTKPASPGASIAIIGAGIAGASLAHALRARGFALTVFDANGPVSGASGNPAGLIMPRLDADTSPIARFNVSAYVHVQSLLARLSRENHGLFHQCGGSLIAKDAEARARYEKILSINPLPDGWIVDQGDALTFRNAGVVDPPLLVRTLLGDTKVRIARVKTLMRDGDQWRLQIENDDSELFEFVIIANSADALRFSQCRTLPLTASAGQIDVFQNEPSPASIKVCGAYRSPLANATGKGLAIGATYTEIAPGATPTPRRSATQQNLDAVAQFDDTIVQNLSPEYSTPRASVRCVTPDQTPIVGPVPDWGHFSGAYDGLRHGRIMDYPPAQYEPGLFVLTGLGSRGLVTATLCAEIIASQIAGAPPPVAADIEDSLNPARFFIRALKRKKARHG